MDSAAKSICSRSTWRRQAGDWRTWTGVVAHHQPASGPRRWQGEHELRNMLWSTWLRRPLPRALLMTGVLTARGGDGTMRGLVAALRGLPWVMRERRVVPPQVERQLRLVQRVK